MRILFINDMYTVGGATKALCEMLIRLKKIGHDPIVCTSFSDWFNEYLSSVGIMSIVDEHIPVMEVIPDCINNKNIWIQKRRIKYFIKRFKSMRIIENSIDMRTIDIIHTNSIRNDIGCMLSKKYHIPHIAHVREFGIEHFSCKVHMPFYFYYLNMRCNKIITVSNALKRSMLKRGIIKNKICTLYDGVDFDGFIVNENNIMINNRLNIVMVGGICETKGQGIALQALNHLPKDIYKNVYIDFIGWCDPSYMDRLNKYIINNGLYDHVRFLGEKKNVAKYLHNYNVGLMCSKSEGFGRVTAEYMYSGLAVIAADSGASPELIRNNERGLIYNRNDFNDLSEKIIKLYKNPELMRIYGRNAHIHAEKYYSINRFMSKLLLLYNEVVGETNE